MTVAGRAALALLAAAAAPLPARAYRPFDSTDAAVADKGRIEIELGPLGFVQEGSERWLVAPSVILNWGFADRWEVVLEGRHFVHLGSASSPEPRLRVEDVALSLKTVLREGSLQERGGVSIATEIGALLPAVNGEDGAGAQAAIIASRRWEAVTVHLNGAAAWTRQHDLGLFGGVIVEAHDAWTVRPVTEVFVEAQGDLPVVVSWLAGAIWRARDDLYVDAGVRLARAGGVDTTEIRLGLTWELPVGFPDNRRKP
jgi:hypothetical protein